jgi:hypothetical protein
LLASPSLLLGALALGFPPSPNHDPGGVDFLGLLGCSLLEAKVGSVLIWMPHLE